MSGKREVLIDLEKHVDREIENTGMEIRKTNKEIKKNRQGNQKY